ncbi:MAG: helix-turn-helix domain-containing protein [Alphaproteobacteria bacterium]|nr:helix-turn-helix domain-containing protein [Alphaproteobacteria bacterium]
MLSSANIETGTSRTFPRLVQRTPGRAVEACFAEVPSRQLRANEPLFAEGDAKTGMYQVEAGAVLIYKILSDGLRQIVNFAFPGDIIGLDASHHYTYDAQTIAPTRVRSLSCATLWRRAEDDPAIARELFEILSREVSDTREHLLTIGRLNATGRIANLLMALSRRNERKGLDALNLLLPLRRSDMADFLCLSVETVSRSLTELKLAGIVSLRGWRQIKLVNRNALQRLATGETRIEDETPARRAA